MKKISCDSIQIQDMPLPTGNLFYMDFIVPNKSKYRAGTFLTCVDNGNVFLHDGWMYANGLGVVLMGVKNEFSLYKIERNNKPSYYKGNVRLAYTNEIEDFLLSLKNDSFFDMTNDDTTNEEYQKDKAFSETVRKKFHSIMNSYFESFC